MSVHELLEQHESERHRRFRDRLQHADRIVVKAGTDSITNGAYEPDREVIQEISRQLAGLADNGRDVMLVSSGAVGTGIGRLELAETPDSVEHRQAASSIGQGALFREYGNHFEEHGREVAQLLVTQDDLEDDVRFANVTQSLERLLDWEVVPIINENDAVAVDHCMIGDNDFLAAQTAAGVNADLLVLLTDVDGLHTDDPKTAETAERISAVPSHVDHAAIIKTLTANNGTGDSRFGGGMHTKVQSAAMTTEHGIPVVVANARTDEVLHRIVNGHDIGTLFLPRDETGNQQGEEQ